MGVLDKFLSMRFLTNFFPLIETTCICKLIRTSNKMLLTRDSCAINSQ